jgi:SAM-dependent methyltransferase
MMHEDGYFSGRVAASYDDEVAGSDPGGIGPAVDLLFQLANGGRVLELAIGTGRIALPLARRGVAVAGIELSRAMAAQLRAKDGDATIEVTIGDMATTRIAGRFSLVYLVFNTINNLTTQEAQIACFHNAAAHLAPGGCFLIEVGVPPLQRLPRGETRLAFAQSATHWGIDELDVVTQSFTSHHMTLRDGSWEPFSVPFRYVWPAELDLMARLAGLSLEARWGGWRREPFTSLSESHVSVWRKPAADEIEMRAG